MRHDPIIIDGVLRQHYGTFDYVYDSVGNMTAFTQTVDSQTTSVSRSFDTANRLQTSTDLDAGTTNYSYDENGNLVEELGPPTVDQLRRTYTYNQRNLLVTVHSETGVTIEGPRTEYEYDGEGNRLHQRVYGPSGVLPLTLSEAITYTNDVIGLTQVMVADDGTVQVYNLFGLDLISQDNGSEVRTLLVDGLGSVRTEMVGAVVETATTYTPYGEVLEQTGTSGTAYGFTGEQEDSATELLYLRARYYSFSLKTFMNRDRWEGTGWRPGTLNYYLYASSNPINYVDPTGLWRWAAASFWHRAVEDWYETNGASAFAGVNLNPVKQLEYLIPYRFSRPDMFNSLTGAVYEVEPVYNRNAAGEGITQARRYVDELNNARLDGLLTDAYAPSPLGLSYDWNATPFHLGTGLDWPGQLRVVLANYPDFEFVADFVAPGLVLYWFEQKAAQAVPVAVPDPALIRPRNWNPAAIAQPVPAPVPVPGPVPAPQGTPVPPGQDIPSFPGAVPVPLPVPTPPVPYANPSVMVDSCWAASVIGGSVIGYGIYRVVRFIFSPLCGPAAPVCALGPP